MLRDIGHSPSTGRSCSLWISRGGGPAYRYLPQLYPAAACGQGDNSARGLVLAAIGQVLMQYEEACRQ
jgi:hypothetical protein